MFKLFSRGMHIHAHPGFLTRMVYLYYILCLRYTILVENPRYACCSSNSLSEIISQGLPTNKFWRGRKYCLKGWTEDDGALYKNIGTQAVDVLPHEQGHHSRVDDPLTGWTNYLIHHFDLIFPSIEVLLPFTKPTGRRQGEKQAATVNWWGQLKSERSNNCKQYSTVNWTGQLTPARDYKL